MNDLHVFDAHADTISYLRYAKQDLRHSPGHWDLARAGEFAGFGQIFALWADWVPRDALWAECQGQYETYLTMLARYPERIRHCRTARDAEDAWRAGKAAAFLSVEGAEMLDCDIAKLDIAADWSVRALNLTWNFANELSGSNAERPEQGLSARGREFLRAMEERGILPDVSHLSDAGTWDVLRWARGPVIASHSNARALCPHRRNLTDDMFRAIRDSGGFVGLNAYLPFVGGGGTMEDLAGHLEHFLSLDGEKTLGLGGDWDGCDAFPQGITGIESLLGFRDFLRAREEPNEIPEHERQDAAPGRGGGDFDRPFPGRRTADSGEYPGDRRGLFAGTGGPLLRGAGSQGHGPVPDGLYRRGAAGLCEERLRPCEVRHAGGGPGAEAG